MTAHAVTVELGWGRIDATFSCSASRCADCYWAADCDCPTWTVLYDADDVWHEAADGERHSMRPSPACTVIVRLGEADPWETYRGPTTTARSGPITVSSDGDEICWSYAIEEGEEGS